MSPRTYRRLSGRLQSAHARQPSGTPARELLIGRWPGQDDEMEIERAERHVSDNWPELSEALIRVVETADLGPAAGVDLLVVTRQTAAIALHRPSARSARPTSS